MDLKRFQEVRDRIAHLTRQIERDTGAIDQLLKQMEELAGAKGLEASRVLLEEWAKVVHRGKDRVDKALHEMMGQPWFHLLEET